MANNQHIFSDIIMLAKCEFDGCVHFVKNKGEKGNKKKLKKKKDFP